MEQILFLILVAVVGGIRWIVQAAENRKNAEAEKRTGTSPPPNAPVQRAPAMSEEERVRRFMEALGVPTSTSPAPTVQPRPATPTAEPPKRQLPIDPFPRGSFERKPLPEPVFAPPPRLTQETPPPLPPPTPTALPLPRRIPARVEAAEFFEVQDLDRATVVDVPSAATKPLEGTNMSIPLAGRVASSEGLRDAIILREVFGPPRSMQPLDRMSAIANVPN